jgi:vancomycin resistance protein YoaR
VPAVVGSAIAPLTASPSFLAALTSPTRTALIPMVSTAPTLTTEMVQAWGIKEPISTFTTHFPFNPPRTNNMTIAAAALNGTIVRSGDQFSLNAILGERTPAKGYLKAPVIYAGRLEKAYGGGVSQVSTTVFNAAFFAGVRIDDHTTHSFYISRYPEGREATLSWPDVDQKWTNDSGSGILISSSLTGSDLTVTFFGTKAWEIEAVKGPRRNMVPPKIILDGLPGCVPQAPTPGFDVTVTRIFKRDGARVKSSQFNTHYIPEDNVSCTSPS